MKNLPTRAFFKFGVFSVEDSIFLLVELTSPFLMDSFLLSDSI